MGFIPQMFYFARLMQVDQGLSWDRCKRLKLLIWGLVFRVKGGFRSQGMATIYKQCLLKYL